jgi:hypothetical protein
MVFVEIIIFLIYFIDTIRALTSWRAKTVWRFHRNMYFFFIFSPHTDGSLLFNNNYNNDNTVPMTDSDNIVMYCLADIEIGIVPYI